MKDAMSRYLVVKLVLTGKGTLVQCCRTIHDREEEELLLTVLAGNTQATFQSPLR